MTTLPPADRVRLAKVLGMLGSPHPGERDAAALAADRLVRQAGASWSDVLGGGARPGPDAGRAPDPVQPYPPRAGHVADLATIAWRPDLLTPWESQFVAGVAQGRTVSPRQRDILAKLAARVRSAGPRAG